MGKNWIQSAIKKPGALDRYCHSNHASAACLRRASHSRSGIVRRRAALANTLRHLPRHHGPRR